MRAFVSPPICQAPSFDALERDKHAVNLIVINLDSIIVPEVKFAKVALQMLLADILEYAHASTPKGSLKPSSLQFFEHIPPLRGPPPNLSDVAVLDHLSS